MKTIRKIAMVFAVAAIAVCSLSAATWVWSSPYDNVTGYRYQIGSESEDGWIYVDKDITSLTLDTKDEMTVYVQLTVDDGRFWSPSGIATFIPQEVLPVDQLTSQDQVIYDPYAVSEPVEATPVFDAIPAVTEEAVIPAEVAEVAPEEEILAVEPEVPAEEEILPEEVPAEVAVPEEEVPEAEVAPVEEPVAEEPLPAEEIPAEEPVEEPAKDPDETILVNAKKARKGKDFSFGMGIGVAVDVQDWKTFALQPVLSFNFENVASPAQWFGLDVDLNLIGIFTPDAKLNVGFIKFVQNMLASRFAMGGAIEAALRPTFMFSNCEIGISLGGGANIYAAPTLTGNANLGSIPVLTENEAIKLNAYALAGIDGAYNFTEDFNISVGYRFKYVFDKDIRNSQMGHGFLVKMGFSF